MPKANQILHQLPLPSLGLIVFFCSPCHKRTNSIEIINEPRHEKICLRGLRPGKTQTGLLSWRFEISAIASRCITLSRQCNKCTDQTAWMRRLIFVFVVRIWHKQGISWRGSHVYKAVFLLHFCNKDLKHKLL